MPMPILADLKNFRGLTARMRTNEHGQKWASIHILPIFAHAHYGCFVNFKERGGGNS